MSLSHGFSKKLLAAHIAVKIRVGKELLNDAGSDYTTHCKCGTESNLQNWS